jgi:hypothetical protein
MHTTAYNELSIIFDLWVLHFETAMPFEISSDGTRGTYQAFKETFCGCRTGWMDEPEVIFQFV